MVADGEQDPEFDLIVESTGLDLEQVEQKQKVVKGARGKGQRTNRSRLLFQIDSLKKGFEGFDKEGAGNISQTTMQVSEAVCSDYIYRDCHFIKGKLTIKASLAPRL